MGVCVEVIRLYVVWGSKSDCAIAENAVLGRGCQVTEQRALVFEKAEVGLGHVQSGWVAVFEREDRQFSGRVKEGWRFVLRFSNSATPPLGVAEGMENPGGNV